MDWLQFTVVAIIVSAAFAVPGLLMVMRMPHSKAYRDMEEAISASLERNKDYERRIDDLDARLQRQSLAMLNMREWVRGATLLYEQVVGAKMVPVWNPPIKTILDLSPQLVRNILSDYFNVDEQTDLAVDLGIDPEQISGATKAARARSLVSYADRHGLTDDLILRIKSLRPNVDFDTMMDEEKKKAHF